MNKSKFYRVVGGNAVIFNADGTQTTRLNSDVYPVDSDLSARYEHPEGIVLSVADAKSVGIEEE